MRTDWRTLIEFAQIGDLCLRTVALHDEQFLQQLFRSTRPYLTQIPMPTDYINTILQQQYELQKASFNQQFSDNGHFILLRQQEPVGRLMLYRNMEEQSLRVVDICLLPQWCGQGYGSALLRYLQLLTRKNRWRLQLSVDCQNLRAKKLYRLLGFQVTDTTGSHESMVWGGRPDGSTEVKDQSCRQGVATNSNGAVLSYSISGDLH